MSEPTVQISVLCGSVRIVPTQRVEDGALILGGYAIHYDMHGNETGRTENTDNCRLTGLSEAEILELYARAGQ